MTEVLTVLGFMSGTSLDGIDIAILQTDGKEILRPGPNAFAPMPEVVRNGLEDAITAARVTPRSAPRPPLFDVVGRLVAQTHARAAEEFLAASNIPPQDIDLVGFHGVTVLHERPLDGQPGRTIQLGDAELLAQMMGLDVVHDFRSADVAAGGEGAPLAPVYHRALVKNSGLEGPVAVLNLGGVGNLTLVKGDDLLAFDTGPGNGLMDSWMRHHGAGAYDRDGLLAQAGRVDDGALAALQSHPYFQKPVPKSLDRYDFSLEAVMPLSLEDGLATLAAFTVWSVCEGLRLMPTAPSQMIVCGGGRHNATLLAGLRDQAGLSVQTAEDVGWRGDHLEAEAFAYMAARSVFGLPISFPGTTGVNKPMRGGQLAKAPDPGGRQASL